MFRNKKVQFIIPEKDRATYYEQKKLIQMELKNFQGNIIHEHIEFTGSLANIIPDKNDTITGAYLDFMGVARTQGSIVTKFIKSANIVNNFILMVTFCGRDRAGGPIIEQLKKFEDSMIKILKQRNKVLKKIRDAHIIDQDDDGSDDVLCLDYVTLYNRTMYNACYRICDA